MKATGIVRAIDQLGRIVLPKSLRQEQGIESKDDVEIYVEGEDIILQKYKPRCVFCGESEDLMEFKGKLVCRECRTGFGGLSGHAAD